jgi:hypothetical protein
VKADVHLRDAQLHVAVDGDFDQVNVVDADDFASVEVNDLLVEDVLADGQPAFVGVIGVEVQLTGVEPHGAGRG